MMQFVDITRCWFRWQLCFFPHDNWHCTALYWTAEDEADYFAPMMIFLLTALTDNSVTTFFTNSVIVKIESICNKAFEANFYSTSFTFGEEGCRPVNMSIWFGFQTSLEYDYHTHWPSQVKDKMPSYQSQYGTTDLISYTFCATGQAFVSFGIEYTWQFAKTTLICSGDWLNLIGTIS